MDTITCTLKPAEKARLLAYGTEFEIEALSGVWQVEQNDRTEQQVIAKNGKSWLTLQYNCDSGEVICQYNGSQTVENITIVSGPKSSLHRATTTFIKWRYKYEPLLNKIPTVFYTFIGITYIFLGIFLMLFYILAAIIDSISSGFVTLLAFAVLGVFSVMILAVVRGCIGVIRGKSKSIQINFKRTSILALISAFGTVLLLRPDMMADFLIGFASYHPTDIPAQPIEERSVSQTAMSYYIITILLIGKTVIEGNYRLGIKKRVGYLFVAVALAFTSLIIISLFVAPTRSTLINWVVNVGLVLVVGLLSEYYNYHSKVE